MRSLADVDPSAYQKAENDFNNYQLEKELRRVRREFEKENYRTARTMALKLRKDYDSQELERLIGRAEREISALEVSESRKKKRMLLAAAFGVEAISNQLDDLYAFPNGMHYYTIGYSAGLYKKFNYFKSYSGKYPKGSDLIGLKVRLWDHLTAEAIPWSDEEVLPSETPNRFSIDLLIDGTAFYLIHYGGGLVFSELGNAEEYHYCAELGLRIPMGPVSIQGNIRNDWIDSIPTYRFSTGIFLELDFWRDFGREDREEIKGRLGF